MKNHVKIAIVLAIVCSVSLSAEDFRNARTLLEGKGLNLEFTSYAGFGSGLGLSQDQATSASGGLFPVLTASSGIELTPWLAIGAYTQGVPLSAWEHADPGTRIADIENAFMYTGGSEVLLMPRASSVVHPVVRLRLGGATVGHLEDTDGEEGFDQAVTDRWFHAAASAGAELNLSRHLRVWGLAGYRFVGNKETMGIPAGGLSGFEASLGLRCLWRTVVD
ncbi:MAG: hypothetical protein RBT68_12645 [Spirochaetia bacterium]|jgi:hypothetical protein|nr:hypothetical protein [Spirochaetia bacterium]